MCGPQDLVSIIPFDVLGLVLDLPIMAKLKIIRVLRLMRLLKLARIVRASRIFKRMEAKISVSYSVIGLIKFGIMLLMMGHWMACCWVMTARATEDARKSLMVDDEEELGDDDVAGGEIPAGYRTWIDNLQVCAKPETVGLSHGCDGSVLGACSRT